MAKPRRDDPPVVSGDIAIDSSAAQNPEVPTGNVRVMPMASAAPQSPMSSSGSHPIMLGVGSQAARNSSGSHPVMAAPGQPSSMAVSGGSPVIPRRASTDAMYVVDGSRGQSDTTGPSPVVRAHRRTRESPRDSLVLWILAGALVVLALGVVMMVFSWTQ